MRVIAAAKGGRIVIPQHVSCLPSTIWDFIPYYNVGRSPPNPPRRPKTPFTKLYKTFLFVPYYNQATPWQYPGTTQDHPVTAWHHQIAWGTTCQPYNAKKLAKTTSFFKGETSKI